MEGIWNSADNLDTFGFMLRTLLVGIVLFVTSRFLPRRSGGQYAGFDFTFFWMVGGLVASPLYSAKLSFINTISAVIAIFAAHYFISLVVVKSPLFARIVYGKAVVLIENGQIQRKNMVMSLFPLELLLAQLREVNVFNVQEVSSAILETNGHVSVQIKSLDTPVTPHDLNLPTMDRGFPVTLVNDGKVIKGNLDDMKKDEKWLLQELHAYGVSGIKDVYYACIDAQGKIFCIKK